MAGILLHLGKSYLDQVLALGLGDQWLELRGGECVDETRFGDDQKEHLGASKDR